MGGTPSPLAWRRQQQEEEAQAEERRRPLTQQGQHHLRGGVSNSCANGDCADSIRSGSAAAAAAVAAAAVAAGGGRAAAQVVAGADSLVITDVTSRQNQARRQTIVATGTSKRSIAASSKDGEIIRPRAGVALGKEDIRRDDIEPSAGSAGVPGGVDQLDRALVRAKVRFC